MSRRIVAPVLLLVAAACSLAAVFVVHRIEAGIGPVSQPSLQPPAISPNGDGEQDVTTINFTLRDRGPVTVDVVSADGGARVQRLVEDEVRDGEQRIEWDGTVDGAPVPDGEYRVRIRLADDSRAYGPVSPLVVDTVAPIGVLDRATLELGELRGLALLGPGEHLEVFDAAGAKVDGAAVRQFTTRNPDAASSRPTRTVPANTRPWRFTVSIDATPSRIDVVDRSGNRRQAFPGDDEVDYEAKG